MPPRKIKKDPAIVKTANQLSESFEVLMKEYREQLWQVATDTAKSESARILATIPEKYLNMSIIDFLSGPPSDIFARVSESIQKKENEAENLQEEDNDMDIDDAAHETSIPIAPSGQNSGRNTAAETHRNEIITPAGHIFPVPTLHPQKPFRRPYAHEEIAFSVNGSPMVLSGNAGNKENKKKSTKKSAASKKDAAEAGLLVPKVEAVGTSV